MNNTKLRPAVRRSFRRDYERDDDGRMSDETRRRLGLGLARGLSPMRNHMRMRRETPAWWRLGLLLGIIVFLVLAAVLLADQAAGWNF